MSKKSLDKKQVRMCSSSYLWFPRLPSVLSLTACPTSAIPSYSTEIIPISQLVTTSPNIPQLTQSKKKKVKRGFLFLSSLKSTGMLQIIPWIFQGAHPFLSPGNLVLNRIAILIQNKVIMDVHLDFRRLSENWHKPLQYFLLSKTTALEFLTAGMVTLLFTRRASLPFIPFNYHFYRCLSWFKHHMLFSSSPFPLHNFWFSDTAMYHLCFYFPPGQQKYALRWNWLQICPIIPASSAISNFHNISNSKLTAAVFCWILSLSTGLTMHWLSSQNFNISKLSGPLFTWWSLGTSTYQCQPKKTTPKYPLELSHSASLSSRMLASPW